mmetsp:Transcript_12074/g.44079  ORF Transcript_12074/g.44079 Transcript_12074/m.44079 type:complete len:108 (+) Transcript_12074:242-565(+)
MSTPKAVTFLRECGRMVKQIHAMYSLEELVTVQELRSRVSSAIRKNKDITDPQVVEILCIKGREELANILNRWKNRHHVITTYCAKPTQRTGQGASSEFMEKFLRNK